MLRMNGSCEMKNIFRQQNRQQPPVGMWVIILLLGLVATTAGDTGETDRWRFSVSGGIVQGCKPDSSKINFILGAGLARRVLPNWSIGVESSISHLYDNNLSSDSPERVEISVLRVTPFLEYQYKAFESAIPFLRIGGGWYAWGLTPKHCWGYCWRWRDDTRRDSFGANVGFGVRFPMGENKPVADVLLQYHPYSTDDESWRFLSLVFTIGK